MAFPNRGRFAPRKVMRKRRPIRSLATLFRVGASASVALAGSLLLTGCGNFFVYPGSTTTSTGTGSTTTDYMYAANSASGSTYLNGYAVSSGALTAVTNSPFNLDYAPTSIAVTPSNSFVYMSTDSAIYSGAIYGYSIGTGGTLSILNSGSALATDDVASLAVSPDGNWLFALDAQLQTIDEFSINTSTGALTEKNSVALTGASTGTIVPYQVAVAPSGDFVVCALGTGGAETFTFTTSTGGLTSSAVISPGSSAIGIYGVAIDGNNYLYTAGTAGVQAFSTTSAGTPTLLKTYTAGNGAHSIVLSSSYGYLYVGNASDGTISGYSVSSGALTALTGSPYAGPADVSALARDSSGSYLLAEGYNATSGIVLYSIGSAGALTQSAEAASGTTTTLPVAVGATH